MPTKATWTRLETDPAFFLDFYLGEKLGKSVAEIQALSMSEWSAWAVYFSRKAQQRELAAMRAR